MISAIIKKFKKKKTVVIVSLISIGVILVAGLIILFSRGTSKTEEAFDYRATAQEYGVSENVAYLIKLTQQYDENVDVEMLAGMSITQLVDNLRNEYINVFNYKKIAQEYGVSLDAAYLANKIVMLDSNADIELLVSLPITQLVDTLREKLLQPQTQVGDEADSQGTEVAYVDEAEDVDTDELVEDVDTEDANDGPDADVDAEDTNNEPDEDVDTDNNDTDTQDSDSDSGNISSEELKPTEEPEEKPQTEWSEWSEWMLDSELGKILSNIGDKDTEVETYIECRTPVGDVVLKHRYTEVYIEDLGWIDNTDGKTKDHIMAEYPMGDFEERWIDWDESEDPNVPLRYYVKRTKYLSGYGEWLPGPAWSDGYDKARYLCEETVDKEATQWGAWGSECNSAWYDTRTLARYRWRDR